MPVITAPTAISISCLKATETLAGKADSYRTIAPPKVLFNDYLCKRFSQSQKGCD